MTTENNDLKARAWDLANDPDINRSAFEEFPFATIMVNRSRKIVKVNRKACTLFSYHPTELIGQFVEILMPERYRERHVVHFAGYFKDPTVRPMGLNLEIKILIRGGEEADADIFLVPLSAPEGTLAMGVVTLAHPEPPAVKP